MANSTHSTPFEIWYGYSPNVEYFKVFGRKYYILKHNRNGKFDAKSEEVIFLGYSTRSKAYKCLNTNTNKVVESANVKFDEYIEVHEVEPIKEPKEYKSFIYFYEGMPTDEGVVNQVVNQQKVSVTIELHTMNVNLHSRTKLHSGVKLHIEVEVCFDYEISVHERNVDLPDKEVHSDSEVDRPIEERST